MPIWKGTAFYRTTLLRGGGWSESWYFTQPTTHEDVIERIDSINTTRVNLLPVDVSFCILLRADNIDTPRDSLISDPTDGVGTYVLDAGPPPESLPSEYEGLKIRCLNNLYVPVVRFLRMFPRLGYAEDGTYQDIGDVATLFHDYTAAVVGAQACFKHVVPGAPPTVTYPNVDGLEGYEIMEKKIGRPFDSPVGRRP